MGFAIYDNRNLSNKGNYFTITTKNLIRFFEIDPDFVYAEYDQLPVELQL